MTRTRRIEFLLAAAAAGLAAARVAGATSPGFQAVAHLYVGGLFVGYAGGGGRRMLWLALFLTAVEVVCFALFRRH